MCIFLDIVQSLFLPLGLLARFSIPSWQELAGIIVPLTQKKKKRFLINYFKLQTATQYSKPTLQREISHSCLLTEVGLWQIMHFASMPGRQYRKGGKQQQYTDGWKIQQLCQKIDSRHLHSHMHGCSVSKNKFMKPNCHFTLIIYSIITGSHMET